ncbi:MAG: DinB family protein [Ilumatobacteraceae bacterium]
MVDDLRTPLPADDDRAADELATLTAMLGYYRVVMLRKAEGLTTAQSVEQSTPSGVTLLGLVRHLADVERDWFARFAGLDQPQRYETPDDIDGDFHPGPEATIEEAITAYRQEIAVAERVVGAASSLDQTVESRGRPLSLRWILVHMIEETARHAGHADVLRELTDGVVDD